MPDIHPATKKRPRGHDQEGEAAVGPELPSKQQKLRDKIKLTELVSYGAGPALKILQLDGLHQAHAPCRGGGTPLTALQKMFQQKWSRVKALQDSLQQEAASLQTLQNKWGGPNLAWLYDEDQQAQVKKAQDSIRQQAEHLRDALIAWKNEYMKELILSMADS